MARRGRWRQVEAGAGGGGGWSRQASGGRGGGGVLRLTEGGGGRCGQRGRPVKEAQAEASSGRGVLLLAGQQSPFTGDYGGCPQAVDGVSMRQRWDMQKRTVEEVCW